MKNRTEWTALTPWVVNGVEVVTSDDAAAYLGMHIEAFRQIARLANVAPDAQLGRARLYTRATLDALDAGRGKVGRPRLTTP